MATFFLAPSAIPAENTLQCTITYNRSSFTNFAKIFILKTGHIRCYLTGITFATDFLASDRSFESLVTGYIYKGLSNQSLINTCIKYMFQCMYLLKVMFFEHFPCLSVAQIGRLIGCTKSLKTAGSESLVGFINCF